MHIPCRQYFNQDLNEVGCKKKKIKPMFLLLLKGRVKSSNFVTYLKSYIKFSIFFTKIKIGAA